MDSVQIFELTNRNGVTIKATNYGGKVISLMVPDRNGIMDDVVLGYDAVTDYLHGNPFFGAIIGRFANRIANGRFELNGKAYQLAINNRNNSLHGGSGGFHNVLWKTESVTEKRIQFTYYSPDGEEGFPGNVEVRATYELSDENEFVISYQASTDRVTLVNLSHHSFYNLAGAGNGDILNHKMTIYADRFCPIDENLIPTGKLVDIAGTPFDFRQPTKIGEHIEETNDQIRLANGYDHNWVLNKINNDLTLAASVYEPISGRAMEVFTTEPGLQFYSGNFLDGSDIGKAGKKYDYRSAFCLEPQHFPDSPNHPNFPSTVLKPGDIYQQKTIYKFSVE
jgi:aldose 1-epimerase